MMNALLTTKARGSDTNGGFALFEFRADRKAEPPPHVHRREDEAWYVLEGEIEFHVGDEHHLAGPGAFVFGPRDVPHHLTIRSAEARMLTIVSPAGFEGFFDGMSEPARSEGLPLPSAPDLERLARLAARFGCEFLSER